METRKKLRITYAKSTGFDPFFNKVTKGSDIIIPAKAFAGGGFGDIYHAISFNGEKSPLEQVVKIFRDERNEHGWRTISELQEAIIKRRELSEDQGRNFLDDHPCFIGFPQLIFEGVIEREKVRGHITVNLISLGCTSLDKILPLGEDKTNDRINYLKRKAIDRVVMAYQLADCFNVLHDIHYIHADITPDNIMVSLTKPLCVLIDYDSGVIVRDSPDDNPITYGKLTGDWTPPEVQIESREIGFGSISITHHMDLWSIAAAIHNLIFGFPHLFLKHPTCPVYKIYAEKHKNWPDIDLDDHSIEFNTNRENYEFYRHKVFESLELSDGTIKEFRCTFTKGIFQPEYRTEIDIWVYRLSREIGEGKLSQIKTPKWTDIIKNHLPKRGSNKKAVIPETSLAVDNPSHVHLKKKVSEKKESTILHQSKNTSSHDNTTQQPTERDKQRFQSYINELLSDLVNGKESLDKHKSILSSWASKTGFVGEEYLQNFQDFVLILKNAIKNKTISNVDYRILILLAKSIDIEWKSIDKMLKSVKRK